MEERALRKGGPTAFALLAIALLALSGLLPAQASAAVGQPATADWTAYDRPAEFAVIRERDIKVTMSDGVVLRADVLRPDAPGSFPVLLTQTPYNKAALGANPYLVRRGYIHAVVDVRGTGSSHGQWDAFGEREQADMPEIVAWAKALPWSNGNVGTLGPSYMGINQLLTAAQRPAGLKASFAVVPAADTYRDLIFSGGQADIAFTPFWLGAVTAAGLFPTQAVNPKQLPEGAIDALAVILDHLQGAVKFQLANSLQALLGGDAAYDGPFYELRSPIEVVDQIEVPTFVVGGLHDLLQRGEPLVYERLKQNVETRLLMGPWSHVEGSVGAGLARHGLPTLNQIELRWFDHYLKDIDTGVEEIPQVTQYALGAEEYRTYEDWPAPELEPETFYLHAGRALDRNAPTAAEPPESLIQHPLSGICTRSLGQWTAGLGLQLLPCFRDNRLNELGELTYTSAPLEQDLEIQGPIQANVWIESSREEAALSVRVTDVHPGGRSTELSAGWLAGSFRETDESRSRIIDGAMIQPWHPFTQESAVPLAPGQPTLLQVEIFPTNAEIEADHRLRVSIGPSDFPHLLAPLPQLLQTILGQVKVLHDPAHASSVEIPVLFPCSAEHPCEDKPVPNLRRGS